MLHVTSEIGRLRRVLLHEPGPEVDLMVPSMMEELLFDDILFGERAREEHRRMRRLLQILGVEVVEAADLLTETLALEPARDFLSGVVCPDLTHEVRGLFRDLPPATLAETLVTGRRREKKGQERGVERLFTIAPLSNWCFQRDPQVVVGDGVIFGAMATPARWRESLLSRAMFRYHPTLRDSRVILDPLAADSERPLFLGLHRPRLEGGDVLVLSKDVVAIGVSERTNTVAVPYVARALARLEGGPRWLMIVHLPAKRAYMHLDTVFTAVDRDAALVFPPILSEEGPEGVHVYEIDLHAAGGDPEPVAAGDLFGALRRRGVDLEPLPCGGGDPVAQEREQWTDGANCLAVAPGVILLYDRNVGTAEVLDQRGFRVVEAEDVLLGAEEVDLEDDGHRTCILLSSHEISRARGGPHCLSHPLVRDDP